MPLDQTGLTSIEARNLLDSAGPNAVADVAQHPARRALRKLWAPVPWMLEAAILLQICIGDYAEAGVVAVLLLSNAALGFFQEGRAQATLDAHVGVQRDTDGAVARRDARGRWCCRRCFCAYSRYGEGSSVPDLEHCLVVEQASIGRMFFFEKKNQKTFVSLACAAGEARDSIQKSFASFLQKRSAFFLSART